MAGPLIGGGRPISWRLAGFVAVLVLFVSNSRLKAMFGRGEIATEVPLLLFGLILFATLAHQPPRRQPAKIRYYDQREFPGLFDPA